MSKLVLGLLMIALVAISGCAQMDKSEKDAAVSQVKSESVNISSGNMTFPAYLAVPVAEGKWPGVVMIHSFNGLEPGYMTLADRFASEGYVVIAPQWQNFNRTPSDMTVVRLIEDCSAFLKESGCRRRDVGFDRLLRRGKVHHALSAPDGFPVRCCLLRLPLLGRLPQ